MKKKSFFLLIAGFSYSKSKQELTAAVETGVTLREVSEQIGGSIGQIGQQVDQFKV